MLDPNIFGFIGNYETSSTVNLYKRVQCHIVLSTTTTIYRVRLCSQCSNELNMRSNQICMYIDSYVCIHFGLQMFRRSLLL